MEIKEMQMEDVETRMSEIETAMNAEDANIEELSKEVDELSARKAEIKAAAEEKRSLQEKVAAMRTAPIDKIEEKENKEMEEIEIRNTEAYINAYANYVKTGDDRECRALLTENATNGTVQVPDMVYDTIKTAWERDGIMALVRKSYLKGNLRVGFEISGTDATIHQEGAAVTEETLVHGVVELKPQAIKKWISISDEALDMTGQAYLDYIYDELTYRIAKKAANSLLAKIVACDTASTTTQVGVPVVTASSIALGTVAAAMAQLSEEAGNPVVVMNKATWGDIKAAAYAASYPVDPFENLPVVFNNSLPAFTAASTGDTYMIVGDFDQGALANFPNGDAITIKRDDLTLAASDLVRFIGREFVAVEPVAPNAFVKVEK